MLIVFDTAGGHTIQSGGGNFSLTLAANATCLVASIYYNPIAGTVTPPTWNGVSMTLVGSVDFSNNSPAVVPGLQNLLYYLLNPATGTHSLVTAESEGRPLGCSAASYIGVGAVGASGHNGSAVAGTLTTSVTTTKTGSWLVMGASGNNTLTAGTGSTQRNTQSTAQEAIYDSNGAVTVGANTMATGQASNSGSCSFALELQPIINGGFLMFM